MKFFKATFILSILLFATVVFAQEQKIIFIEIQFDRGQVKIGNVKSGEGYVDEKEIELRMAPLQYWLEFISSSGQSLELRKFSLDPFIYGDKGVATQDKFSKLMVLPYYPDIKLLNIYDINKNLIEQKDVSFLIPGCGDGKCVEKENYLICAKDCPAGGQDNWCNNGLVNSDPDCPKIEATTTQPEVKVKPLNKNYILYIVIGSAGLLFIISLAVYLLNKRKQE